MHNASHNPYCDGNSIGAGAAAAAAGIAMAFGSQVSLTVSAQRWDVRACCVPRLMLTSFPLGMSGLH